MSKTMNRQGDPNRLTPVRGGGGDLVASLSGVKRFFFKKLSFHQRRSEDRREAAI
jgi:hypothetical protein